MEAAVLWKAAMKPRLSTGLGKRPRTATRVFHTFHSPCYQKRGNHRNQPPPPAIEVLPMFPVQSVTYVPGCTAEGG
jgi:hypothetical protein